MLGRRGYKKMNVTLKELKLAYQRITTGRNIPYKRFYRHLYMTYQLALDENLKILRQKLMGSWQASKPLRIFTPKASGLQRPLTLLAMEDQIVLQLFTDRFEEKLYNRRKLIENNLVFSNILSKKKSSIFFFQDWRITYGYFQKKCEEHFNSGNRWIAHFDLAAYYDTISHEILIKKVAPRTSSNEPWKSFSKFLKVWSSPDDVDGHGHGIPQGPIASDFLGEIFLLELDEKFKKEGVKYVRYVDDIRIFADSELNAQKAVVELEIFCRNHGLIPQGEKFAIQEAIELKEALGTLPSLNPFDITTSEDSVNIMVPKAEKLFSESISTRPSRITDKTKARYILYRAPGSRNILNKCIKLLARHPEHIDAFCHYFRNFKKSILLEKEIKRIFEIGTPYGYVKGELYQVITRIGRDELLNYYIPHAKADLRNKNACIILKWGAFSLLLRCQEKGLLKISNRIKGTESLLKSLLLPIIPDLEYSADGIIKDFLKDSDFTSGLLVTEQLYKRQIKLKNYSLQGKDCNPVIQNVLKVMGIVGRRYNIKVDQISEILNRLFKVNGDKVWVKLLGNEYIHTLGILVQAELYYVPDRSSWLQYQNSFNDAIHKALMEYFMARNINGSVNVKDRNARLIDFGIRLDSSNLFSRSYPLIADVFREMNKRRNRLPGSHPYDKTTITNTSYLKPQERNQFANKLKLAYEEVIRIVKCNP